MKRNKSKTIRHTQAISAAAEAALIFGFARSDSLRSPSTSFADRIRTAWVLAPAMARACLILGVLFSFSAFAEPIIEIDPIVVTADSDLPSSPILAPSVTQNDPGRSSSSRTVSEAVSEVAGVHVQRYGGLENATAVSIRGSSSDQVDIFVDGIPLDSASGSGVGFGGFSADHFSSIAVYKNLVPAEIGGAPIGGAIELKSRDAKPGWFSKMSLGAGSFGTASVNANTSHGGRNKDFMLGVDYHQTAGDFSYRDDNGTPLNLSDDTTVKRQNNEQRVVHPTAKFTWRLSDLTTLEAVTHLIRTDGGVPGLSSFQSLTADRSLTEWLGKISLKKRELFQNPKISLESSAYWRLIKSQFSDPSGEIGLGAGQDNDDLTIIFGERAALAWKVSPVFRLQPFIEHSSEGYVPHDFLAADPSGSQSWRHQLAFGAEPSGKIGRLSWSAQLRSMAAIYRINNDDPSITLAGTYFSSRVEHPITAGGMLRYEIARNLNAQLSVRRSVRLPKFSELFGDQGYVLGNSQLVSEKAATLGAGLNWKKKLTNKIVKAVTASIDGYVTRSDDLIQFELAGGLARAKNIGRADLMGVEWAAEARFAHGVKMTQSYLWQKADDAATGKRLIGRPEHELNTRASWQNQRVEVGASGNFVHGQFLDALNTVKISHRLRFDADSSVKIGKQTKLKIEARNLTNSKIVDAVGFPLPGRSFFGSIHFEF